MGLDFHLNLKMGFVCLCLVVGAETLAQPQYADQSDEQLTQLAAHWAQLSIEQRRALLTEVKSRRTSAQHRKGMTPVLRIRAQRRFGRTVRQPNGSLVRIETRQQIVRYHAIAFQLDAEHAFGRGFEQRMADARMVKSIPQQRVTPTNPKEPLILRVSHPYRQ